VKLETASGGKGGPSPLHGNQLDRRVYRLRSQQLSAAQAPCPPCPGPAAGAARERQDQAWRGAAPSGSGLIACSFDSCERTEAFF